MIDPFDHDVIAKAMAVLDAAFAHQHHDMWTGERINASPLRQDEVRALRKRDLDRLTLNDLDQLVFKSVSTIGGVPTFKFFYGRFLSAVIRAHDACVSDSYVVLPKLEAADFDQWPDAEKAAVLDAMDIWATQRLAFDAVGQDSESPPDLPDEQALEIREWVNARRQTR